MNNRNTTKEQGFTLIEMMISVAIFALVLLVALGAILTIIDANRKSRTLTSVMNNITFAFDNITRTVKSGINPEVSNCTGTTCTQINVCSVDLSNPVETSFTRVGISYRLQDAGVYRCVDSTVTGDECSGFSCDSDDYVPITAPEVVVSGLDFDVYAGGSRITTLPSGDDQPRIQITIDGEVKLNKIASEFSMQTSVAQRRLNVAPSP